MSESYLLRLSPQQLATLQHLVSAATVSHQRALMEFEGNAARARKQGDGDFAVMNETIANDYRAQLVAVESLKPLVYGARPSARRRLDRNATRLIRRQRS